MSALAAIRSLRLSQGFFTVSNLGLASYLVYQKANVSNNVTVSLVAACISVVGALCAPSASSLASMRPGRLYFAFAVDWVVAFFNLMALIFLAIFVTTSSHCEGNLCTVAKVDTVMTGFNFSNWIATATYLGIQISKLRADTGSVPVMGKIRIYQEPDLEKAAGVAEKGANI